MENQTPSQPLYTPPSTPIALPNATAVLVLGIISLVGICCYGVVGLICGIIALVLASKDLKLYTANPGYYTPNSYSNLKSGRICAIIGVSVSAVYLVVVVIYIILFGMAFLSNPGEMFRHHYSTSMSM